jgi:hypothetical protein
MKFLLKFTLEGNIKIFDFNISDINGTIFKIKRNR